MRTFNRLVCVASDGHIQMSPLGKEYKCYSEGYILSDIISVLRNVYNEVHVSSKGMAIHGDYDVFGIFPDAVPIKKYPAMRQMVDRANIVALVTPVSVIEHSGADPLWIRSADNKPRELCFTTVHADRPGLGPPEGYDHGGLPLRFEYHPAVKALSPEAIMARDRDYAVWNCQGVNRLDQNGYQVAYFRECLERLTALDIEQLYLFRGQGNSRPKLLQEFGFDVVNVVSGSISDAEYENLVAGAFSYLFNDDNRRAGMSIPIALCNGVPVFCPEVYWDLKGDFRCRQSNSPAVNTHLNYYQYLCGNPDDIDLFMAQKYKRVELSLQVSSLLSMDSAIKRYRAALECVYHWRERNRNSREAMDHHLLDDASMR